MALFVLCGMTVLCAAFAPRHRVHLQPTRHSPDDLEVSGSLRGLPPGTIEFIAYSDLLSLPQETYRVTNDTNFGRPITVSGIPLETLPRLLGAQQGAAMVIAVADDQYAGHYPASYLQVHHPLLVLKVNGKDSAHWPLGIDGVPLGPYMISHPNFKPSFRVLSHNDEAQVPWGVVRINLRRESEVYGPIQPPHAAAKDSRIHEGYTIASQNCFRCHSRLGEGGRKSRILWDELARKAVTSPSYFDAYVRDPKKLNPKSQMAASPQYDHATMLALRQYFATFAEPTR